MISFLFRKHLVLNNLTYLDNNIYILKHSELMDHRLAESQEFSESTLLFNLRNIFLLYSSNVEKIHFCFASSKLHGATMTIHSFAAKHNPLSMCTIWFFWWYQTRELVLNESENCSISQYISYFFIVWPFRSIVNVAIQQHHMISSIHVTS